MASSEMLVRALAGFAAASLIAVGAYRARALDKSGAVAASLTGSAAAAAGWSWGALLILYFVVSSLLSRIRRAERDAKTDGVVEKSGARDATQVLANGGIFALSALMAPFGPPIFSIAMRHAALGALAASAADTWATELGTVFGGTPRSLRTFAPVQPGTSGAVSAAGCIAMAGGAVFLALSAGWLGLSPRIALVALAGIVGALVDSVLGATLQDRRWCDICDMASEQHVHRCGAATRLAGGRGWMDNDVVNLLSTFAGAAIAAGVANL